ncbi:hypothetical protein PoB_003960200 [Plakobranchus ocellatus]|uniref:Secreted protein n=1 Tax=Plakobranchus ocellatus TaxID=259542 RepID=A0AAV4B1X2_9GAST|nr:hypothetical protein PoB_003960200 [Plakobranchus ocellatus]
MKRLMKQRWAFCISIHLCGTVAHLLQEFPSRFPHGAKAHARADRIQAELPDLPGSVGECEREETYRSPLSDRLGSQDSQRRAPSQLRLLKVSLFSTATISVLVKASSS